MQNMPKIFQQESRVIALGEESNDMYMSLDMIFLTSEVNLNKIEYSEDFIYGIESEKKKYIGLPLQCDVTKLEKGEYGKLTHKYNKKTKTFGTVSIGSFVDFKTQKNGDILELVASARVWKRNPKTCLALEELYGSDEGLKFSYEVLVGESTVENGITKVSKDDSNNPIGSCVVSTPAVPASTATLLVAELSNQTIEGGENMSKERNANITCEEMFAETKVHMTDIAELDMSQIRKKIYKSLKDLIKDDYWNWDIIDQFPGYIIIQNYQDGDYYKLDFTVSDTNVTLSEKKKVTKNYQEIQEELEMATIAELELKIKTLNTEIASKDLTIKEKETEVATANAAVASKDVEIASISEKVTTLSASILEKDNKIKELEPIKASYDIIVAENLSKENEAKKTALKDKFSKLLSAEILAEVEIAEAIQNLDESKLNSKVVEIAMASATKTDSKSKETLVASRITDNVSIGKNDLVSKYITINE